MHTLHGFKIHIQRGFQNGIKQNPKPRLETGLNLFINDQGGYTSVAVALSLLLSITLTFSLASGMWIQNRAADSQAVADASALAGANVVGSYTTLAATLDASVLTLGLTGAVVGCAGLVLCAIPGMSAKGANTVQAGVRILEARQKFATSAVKGLQKLEATLPLIIACRSAAVVNANSTDSISYIGCAIPYPLESQSDFSSLDSGIDTSKLEEASAEISEASDKVKQLQEEADEALRRGWLADCGYKQLYSGMCMYERANTLASLSASANPFYASPDSWTFGAALERARAYYQARFVNEAPAGSSENERGDSAIRKYFYQYALSQVNLGSYSEQTDGSVIINLPKLPSNSQELKTTPIYTDYLFPISDSAGVRSIHSLEECRGIGDAEVSYSSMRAFVHYTGPKRECAYCHFTSISMGNVSSASTNINNGFEYYYKELREAAQDYQRAANALAEAKRELKDATEKGSDCIQELLDILAVPRPKLCPPGAYGCVAAVWRSGELVQPDALSTSFTSEARVGAGAAVSAAALAPDNNTSSNDVLVRFMGALSQDLTGSEAGVLGNVGELWSGLLGSYANAYDGIQTGAVSILDKIEGIPGSSAASWLCSQVSHFVEAAGFEPADLRLRKPVLTNSQNVFDRADATSVGTARQFVELLGQSSDVETFAHNLGQDLSNELEGETFTIAEVPIPGTDLSVPLTVDIGEFIGEVA